MYIPRSLLLLCIVFFTGTLSAEEDTAITIAFSKDDPPTSYSDKPDGIAKGILPELAHAVFDSIDGYALESHAYPWERAKMLAEHGKVDALLTYPSESRKAFMLFSQEPTYVLDYGYIIYNRDNPRAHRLSQIEHSNELYGLTLLVDATNHDNSSWEDQILPGESVKRIHKQNIKQVFHEVFLRGKGDFFLRNIEEARFLANQLGYTEKFAAKQITPSQLNIIPFHLGIRLDHPDAHLVIALINEVQQSETFQRKAVSILNKYR